MMLFLTYSLMRESVTRVWHILVFVAIALYVGLTVKRGRNFVSLIGIFVLILLGTLGRSLLFVDQSYRVKCLIRFEISPTSMSSTCSIDDDFLQQNTRFAGKPCSIHSSSNSFWQRLSFDWRLASSFSTFLAQKSPTLSSNARCAVSIVERNSFVYSSF